MKNIHEAALDSLIGDMDDVTSGKMFPKDGAGATITIEVEPGVGEKGEEHEPENCPKGEEGCELCKGGMMAKGGEVGDMANEGTGGMGDVGEGRLEKPVHGYFRGGRTRLYK